MVSVIKEINFINEWLINYHDDNIFNSDGTINRNYNSFKKTGFFAFLHTFGRDLKWNPHIHVLIAELKVKENGYQKWNYFNYDALSKRFQKVLLDKEIGESFKEEKNYHIKIIKRGSMYMLNLKNLKILKMALNMLLDIVVEFL